MYLQCVSHYLCVCVCLCMSEGYPHRAFSRSVYSCKSFQTITFADIKPQKPREKQRERFILTGTAAIRVGCRTLMSPLLPFFILVDYKVKTAKKEEKHLCKILYAQSFNLSHPICKQKRTPTALHIFSIT